MNMDDSQGPQAKLVIRFAEQLKEHLEIPIYFQDERLSTFGAEEKMASVKFIRGRKRRPLDAIAAAEILKSFLEQKKTR